MSPRRFLAGTVLAALALTTFALTGCSTPPPPSSDVSPLYEAEFAQAQQEATTDFERDVLEDNVITRDEYLEAKDRQIECIRSHGLTAELQDMGSGTFQVAVGGTWDEDFAYEVMSSCDEGTVNVIEPLYMSMLQNPQKRNLDDLTAECLIAVGLVDEPFSGKHYERESNTSQFMTRVMDDPEGSKCMQNPSYHTGLGTG